MVLTVADILPPPLPIIARRRSFSSTSIFGSEDILFFSTVRVRALSIARGLLPRARFLDDAADTVTRARSTLLDSSKERTAVPRTNFDDRTGAASGGDNRAAGSPMARLARMGRCIAE
jgi:hypothetical protein